MQTTTNEKSSQLKSYQNVAVRHHLSIDDDNDNDSDNNNESSFLIKNIDPHNNKTVKMKSGILKRSSSPSTSIIIARIRYLLMITILFIASLYIYRAVSTNVGPGSSSSSSTSASAVHDHDHTIPTLLSIRSDSLHNHNRPRGDYVNALDAVVYDIFKEALFNEDNSVPDIHSSKNDTIRNISIKTNKDSISFHDSLAVSWSYGKMQRQNENKDGDDVLHYDANSNEDVIALYCPASESDPQKFKDAATISQIVVTNAFNVKANKVKVSSNDDNDNDFEGSIYTNDDYENEYKYTNGNGNGSRNRNRNRRMSNHVRRRRMSTSTITTRHEWFIPSFPIVREETCEFRLWLRGHNDYHEDCHGRQVPQYNLGARTGPFTIANALTVPTTIHLALTTDPTEMMVQFSTGGDDGASIPIVVYDTDEDLVKNGGNTNTNTNISAGLQFQTGNSTTYQATDMCQQPATLEEPGKFSSPGMLHSIVMKDLDPNKTYYYKVGILYRDGNFTTTTNDDGKNSSNIDMDKVLWSDVNAFESPLPSSNGELSSQEPFTFIVYADQGVMGYGNDDGGDRTSLWMKEEIELNNIRSIHHIGDLSYAQGASHVWDQWLDMLTVFSTRVPLMVGVGNHEYDHTAGGENGKDPSGVLTPGGFSPRWGNFGTDSNGECGVPIAKRFIMPQNGNGVFWYSFSSGNVRTIMLSSEHDLSPGSRQHTWLEMELSSIDRTVTPWVILEAHRPMYNNEDIPKNTKVGIGMRNEFEDLLYNYGVDLFISGHYHSYMRSCAGLYKGICDNGGPVHITVGTAGAELDDAPLLNTRWGEKYIAQWGYGRITSFSNNKLLWEFVSDSSDGEVEDAITIFK